nr:PREDICTED: uncharacterized protein LOC103986317 [Musa acuminata subsp. malaccensis]
MKQILGLSSIIVTINITAVTTLFTGFQELKGHVKQLHLVICAFLTFSDLLCGLSLMFLTSYLLSDRHPAVLTGQFSSPITLLIIISCSLLILTAASFLYLIHKLLIFLAALFPPSLIIGLIYCCSIQTDDHGATGYESYKSELKQFQSLSSTVTSLAFGGLVATSVGYSKKSSEQALTQIMEVSILLMFFVSMMGLFLMMWNSAPPRMQNQTARVFFPKVLKTLSYSLLGLLAVTATVVASAYLESYLPLALSPVLLLGVIVWFVMIPHCQGGRLLPQIDTMDHKAELKPMSKVATVTTQITFGGMMSVFSGLFGDKDSGFQHKIFMLLMFFAFLSSFSVNLLTVSTPKAATQITVIWILNTCTFFFLALGAAAVYLVVVMGG